MIEILFTFLIIIFKKNIPRMKKSQIGIIFYSLKIYLDLSENLKSPLDFLYTIID